MYALTLHQPWAGLILHRGKTVENRGWPPPRDVGRIAVHAGRTRDQLALDQLSADGRIVLPSHYLATGLLGTVAVIGAHTAADCPGLAGCRQWGTSSGWHWLLEDPRPMPAPILVPGQRKLWRLDPDHEKALLAA